MKQYLISLCLAVCTLYIQTPMAAQSSDNGDGTFTNPVLWADLPDPDVIQVGDTFYFVSTSMFMAPGVTILKSKDLVNWSIAANVVPRFDDDPYFDLQGGNRYGKGQWATALRYWGGEFHVLFTDNANGTFIYSSPTIDGTWKKTTVYDGAYHPILDRLQPLQEQDRDDGYNHHVLYDPGFLVDNDGRVYVVHGNSLLYITELDPVALQPLGKARVLYRPHREGLEGNRPYHIGDYYYVICTYGGSHSGNVTCLRSRSLDGPWEEREVMCSGARMADSHILQACLVPLASGETWAMAFLDMGVLGRIPHLVPIHWIDGWPVFGDWANGNITLPKPAVAPASAEKETFATSDDFSSTTLGLQWQFNHNPDVKRYSLTERPGWLRVHATRQNFKSPKVVTPESSIEVSPNAPLLMARNTLTQRLFGPRCQVTAKVDVSHLKIGDKAGLAILNIPYGTLTITRDSKGLTLQQTEGDNKSETAHESVAVGAALWLRADIDGQYGWADFSYSTDGETYHPLGKKFKMEYSGSYFMGNRTALFCYSQNRAGGYIDVDDFKVDILPLFDRHVTAGSTLQAEWTDALWRTECRWSKRSMFNSQCSMDNMDVAWTGDGGLIRFRRMSFADDIHSLAFTLRNVDSHNTLIEVADGTSGELLGRADIMEPTSDYQVVEVTLTKSLKDVTDLVVRIWNHDWDVPKMGKVLLDKITFQSVLKSLYTSIRHDRKWLDTEGKPIQAHGFQILERDGTYYWYGENKEFTTLGSHVWTYGIRCYRSTDFYNWEDCGLIIPPDTLNPLSPLHYSQNLDRPHIIYCEKTGKYVCWIKSMDEDGYFVILQADDILGPYEFVRSLKPEGYGVGDFELWTDPETQKAYVWFERPHWELICADLTDDYTDVTPVYSSHFVGRRPPFTREAPTHFMHDGKHYLFTSGTTGYYPNETIVATFTDPHGEYTELGNPHPSDLYRHSFGSQITDVVQIPSTDFFVAVADRWMPELTNTTEPMAEAERMIEKYKNHQPFPKDFSTPKPKDKRHERRTGWDVTNNATYVFLPITFKDGMPMIEWQNEWRIENITK